MEKERKRREREGRTRDKGKKVEKGREKGVEY